jgi:hypothetical protein
VKSVCTSAGRATFSGREFERRATLAVLYLDGTRFAFTASARMLGRRLGSWRMSASRILTSMAAFYQLDLNDAIFAFRVPSFDMMSSIYGHCGSPCSKQDTNGFMIQPFDAAHSSISAPSEMSSPKFWRCVSHDLADVHEIQAY